jgi:hypothetical protein
MRNRKPNNSRSARREFSRTASKTHRKNIQTGPMRGGIRL